MNRETAVVLSYVPAVLTELVSRGGERLPWGGTIEGTLVMADVSGFTTMSERLAEAGPEGAERLTDIINGFFGQHLELAREHGGDTLTFGGDAILLLFRDEGHADRAVAAACKMLTETERMRSVGIPGGRVKLGMSVGAHSGAFLLAAAGAPEERMQLLVLGSSAARVAAAEGRAGRGELVVSPETAGVLQQAWRLEEVDGWIRVSAPQGSSCDMGAVLEHTPGNNLVSRLLPFTPPSVKEAVQAGRAPNVMAPEHRRASVAFIQVLGLNDILESDGVEAAMSELQEYISGVVGLAAKHHGFLVSTDIDPKGFKLVVTFGAPVAHEFAAANSARFVIDLQELVEAKSGRLTQRVGLNGGHVFAGDVGPPWRRQYTVMGDEVNLTARLMGSAEPGTALAARSWADQAGSQFCVGERSPIRVKGKSQPIPVCVLEAERSEEAPSGRWTTPLFGRERELDRFAELWREVCEGRGKTLLVTGEAGVGKTRFLDEALRAAAPDADLLRTSCQEHLEGIPFAPWVDLLSRLLGMEGKESAGARSDAATTAIARLAPDMAEFAPLLNPLLNLGLPPSEVVSSLDVQSRRERLFGLVSRLVTASCAPQGQVLLIEDVHWADDSTLALLGHLAESMGTARLLLLLSSRDADGPPSLVTFGESLPLAELTREDSLGLIRSSLEAPDLPEAVADAVHTKTRGNPLFLEEVILSLRSPGVLERIMGASSVAQAAELAALAIPDRVQGLLMSRLDALPPDEREVLKVAAVVGREFEPSVLRGLDSLPVPAPVLERVLGNLDRASLIAVAGPLGVGGGAPNGEAPTGGAADRRSFYTFRHALLQEVVYDTLPYARRREIHGEVAAFLEVASERPDHGLLVHHYRQAGDEERLRINAARAAESSQEVYAFREAIDYLSIALETVRASTAPQASLRSRFEELTGDCLESLARHDEAVENYVRARRRWRSPSVRNAAASALAEVAPLSDPEARASDLCRKIGVSIERQHRDYRRALRWLVRAEEVLPRGRTALAARLQVTRGVIFFRLGRFEEALAYGERGLALARKDGDDALQAYALAMLVSPLIALGLLQRSIETSLEAVALYERAGDLAGQASSHGNLAVCYLHVGNLRQALAHQQMTLELNQRLSYETGVAIAHNNLAEVLLLLGETAQAIEYLQKVVDRWEERDMPPALVGLALVYLSKALLRQREVAAAGRALEQGRQLLVRSQARGLLIEADLQGVKLLLSEGRVEEARSACREVIEAAREAVAKVHEAHGLSLMGRLELSCRNLEAAEEHLHCSIELAADIGADYERGLALLTLSELYALGSASGSGSHAEPLAQAIALFQGMGAEHDLKRACDLRDRCSLQVPDRSMEEKTGSKA